MSDVMDRLVAGARGARDAQFNTLDAVDRQARAAGVALAARIESIIASHRSARRRAGDEQAGDEQAVVRGRCDTRFYPEDEWELARPSTPPSGAGPRAGRRDADSDSDSDGDSDSDSDSDSEDYPPTWLR
jgi:hypothetical protein